MTISIIFSINQDVIQVYNNKDIKLLRKELVDISLEACWYVCSFERYHLVLEVTVLSSKRGLPLVSFANSHLVIGRGEVKLSKPLSPSKLI